MQGGFEFVEAGFPLLLRCLGDSQIFLETELIYKGFGPLLRRATLRSKAVQKGGGALLKDPTWPHPRLSSPWVVAGRMNGCLAS